MKMELKLEVLGPQHVATILAPVIWRDFLAELRRTAGGYFMNAPRGGLKNLTGGRRLGGAGDRSLFRSGGPAVPTTFKSSVPPRHCPHAQGPTSREPQRGTESHR